MTRSVPSWVRGIVGAFAVVGVWEVLALTVFHGVSTGVPTPAAVAKQVFDDFVTGSFRVELIKTVREAAIGYVGANLLALALGFAFVQIPLIEKALLRLAIASYCLPIIAVAPILSIALGQTEAPRAVLAGLLVFFPSLVGVVVGLRSADKTALDLIHAAGGSQWTQMVKVRARAALPSIFAALQIAAPSALLGAIIGEYLGGQVAAAGAQGIGVQMVYAEQSFRVARTWGLAVVCTATAGVLYALTGLIGRRLTPWAAKAGQ